MITFLLGILVGIVICIAILRYEVRQAEKRGWLE